VEDGVTTPPLTETQPPRADCMQETFMPFAIDWNAYRLVDLSLPVFPNQTVPGRPFEVKRSHLPDGTHKFDIVNTHTHVGSHIESPWHFYGEGKTCTDYPLDFFMGTAALLRGVP